jgi:hypothetical protein
MNLISLKSLWLALTVSWLTAGGARAEMYPAQLRLMLGLKAWHAVLYQYQDEVLFDFDQARRAASEKLPAVIAEFIKANK